MEIKRDPRKMGKVDGLIMVLRKDQPPRLAYIELGMSTLAHRLHPRLASGSKRWGGNGGATRQAFSRSLVDGASPAT